MDSVKTNDQNEADQEILLFLIHMFLFIYKTGGLHYP